MLAEHSDSWVRIRNRGLCYSRHSRQHDLPNYVGSPCSLNPLGVNVGVGPAQCCAHSEFASQLQNPSLGTLLEETESNPPQHLSQRETLFSIVSY